MSRGNYKDANVQDWRSTGRKRGRKALFNVARPFKCVGVAALEIECGKTTRKIPPDAPKGFADSGMWPKEKRVLSQLQVDHENKDYRDNDPANLNWRCPSCHRLADNQTGVGVSTVGDWTGYL